jgi:hypothetical protein
MGINPEKKEDNNRSRYSYFFWDDRRDTKKKKDDEFRVAANVQNRQVMLWATDIELKEVNNLLVKLGEIPPEQGLSSRIRVIDATNTQQTYEYLEQLQKQLQLIAPHRLKLPPREQFNKEIEVRPKEDSGKEPEEAPAIQPQKKGAEKKSPPIASASTEALVNPIAVTNFVSADASHEDEDPPTNDSGSVETPSIEEPIRSSEDFDRVFGGRGTNGKSRSSTTENPGGGKSGARGGSEIRIELDANGNLVLMSDDPEALNLIEGMMLQTPPPRRPYVVFHIKFGPASFIKGNLDEYFSDFIEKKKPDRSSEDRFYRFIFDVPDDPEKQRLGLGEPPKLRFISDSLAGTIVVTGASEKQLQTIEELIRLWDVPEPSNIKNSRFTKLVEVKYSKASVIAETLKEAYRDLLSANDKAFSKRNENEESRSGGGSGMTDSKSGQNSGKTSFSFKGDLSLGVDDVGNTLLISAKGQELLSLVVEMIEQLDLAAQPANAIEVVPSTSKGVENAIRAMLGKSPSSSSRERDSNSSSSNSSSSSRSR